MFDVLLNSIQQKVNLSEQEKLLIPTFFKNKSLLKRHFLLQQEEECKYLTFVSEGVLRAYFTHENGSEHILQFAFSGWWISDMNSFLNAQPALFNIDALQNAQLLLLTKDNYELLLNHVPIIERYFRLLTINSMIALQRRIIGTLSQNTEEKYINLLNTFPLIFQHVPQHMIASYLGVTAETLSRIRKQISTRNQIL